MNQSLTADILAVVPAAVATGLIHSTLTIQQPDGTYDAAGAPSGAFVAVTGLSGLTVMAAPISVARIQAEEKKALPQVAEYQFLHVFIPGYYPTIQQNWRAVLDGILFEITGVEWDSQKTQTRLKVQQVNL